jgi:hypothetical protein
VVWYPSKGSRLSGGIHSGRNVHEVLEARVWEDNDLCKLRMTIPPFGHRFLPAIIAQRPKFQDFCHV